MRKSLIKQLKGVQLLEEAVTVGWKAGIIQRSGNVVTSNTFPSAEIDRNLI
jgi:purine-nucleoside phosphorylase